MKPICRIVAGAAIAGVLFASPAAAQFADDFESHLADPAGVVLPPQGGWVNPVAGSIDFMTYTYAGNTLGVAPHPTGGGAQFIAATRTTNCGRAQHAGAFAPSGLQNMTFDVYPTFTGTLPAANNIGSVSLQPSTTSRTLIALMTWGDLAGATTWNADFQYWTAANATATTGTTASTAGTLPACFMGLPTNRWYRWSITWDWDTNDIVEITLLDLASGTMRWNRPTGWSLRGGPLNVGAQPMPVDIRFFAGGGSCTNTGAGSGAGNTSVYDNLSIGAGSPAGTSDEYQVNQPGIASGDFNGVPGSALCPAVTHVSFAGAATITLTADAGTFLYDIAFDVGPAIPASTPPAFVLPGGGIFNLNAATAMWLCGGGGLPCLSGTTTLTFLPPPPGLVATAQVVSFGAGPLGLSLGQPFTLVTIP